VILTGPNGIFGATSKRLSDKAAEARACPACGSNGSGASRHSMVECTNPFISEDERHRNHTNCEYFTQRFRPKSSGEVIPRQCQKNGKKNGQKGKKQVL
jgi:hypothetical protein